MEAFTNDYDIVTMDDQELDNFFRGIGVTDFKVKSQNQLPSQNQNTSLNKALTQDDILEPFQNSSGTLDSNNLPNQASAINFQSPVPCTQSMESPMNNEHLERIQADLEDQTAGISTCTKADANTMSDQDFEDIWNVIEDDQIGTVGVGRCQDVQEMLCDSVNSSQDMTQDRNQQHNSNVSMTMNTVNQSGGGHVAVNYASPNFSTEQGATFSPINQGNSEDKFQFPQLIDSTPVMKPSVAVEGNKLIQNSTVMFNSSNLLSVASAVDPNVIHVTWQNSTSFTNQASALTPQTHTSCTQNTGPMKTKGKRTGIVGRCPQGVLPLYLHPEPENEEEKKKWRRAKTAHGHRENKKNALVNDANTIKDLMKEMNELKNELKVVTVQRDTYKNALENLAPRYS